MTLEDQIQQQFPKDKFDRKQYSFSKSELTELSQLTTLQVMGNMAKALIDSLINEKAIPRVGIAITKGMQTVWDQTEGTFTIFTPKDWCELCKDNPSMYVWMEKKYCERCFSLIQMKEQIEKKEHVPTKSREADILSEKNTHGKTN